jgi:hypothetical protein
MSLQDNCIILRKIDVSQNLDKGKPIGCQARGVFNGAITVTVTVNHQTIKYLEYEFARQLYHSPKD